MQVAFGRQMSSLCGLLGVPQPLHSCSPMLPRLDAPGECHSVAVRRHPRAPSCVQAGVGGPVSQLLEQNLAILFQYKQNMAAYKVRPSLLQHRALLLPGHALSGEGGQQDARLPG